MTGRGWRGRQREIGPPDESATERAASQWSAALSALETHLGWLAAAAGLAGVAVYGVLYWFHDTFWAQFGLLPDQVGLTPAVLIPRAAVAIALIVMLVVPLVLAYAVLWGDRPRRWSVSRWNLVAASAYTVVTALLAVYGSVTAVLFATSTVALWVGPASRLLGRRTSTTRGRAFFKAATWFAAVFLLGAGLSHEGGQAATALRNGRTPSDAASLAQLVAGVRLTAATVHWLSRGDRNSEAALDLEGRRVLLLGTVDSVTVLWDFTERRTIRVPADAIVLTRQTR